MYLDLFQSHRGPQGGGVPPPCASCTNRGWARGMGASTGESRPDQRRSGRLRVLFRDRVRQSEKEQM